MFGHVVTDAASFFFAMDEDSNGTLDLKEVKQGLQAIRSDIAFISDKKIDEFVYCFL